MNGINPKFINDAKTFLEVKNLSGINTAATIVETMANITYDDAYSLIENYQMMNETEKQTAVYELAIKIQQKVEALEENLKR